MPSLEFKPTHRPIQNCYSALRQFDDLGIGHEGAVKSDFRSLSASTSLLRIGWGEGGRRPDEVPRVRCRSSSLTYGPWEAEDIRDDLDKEDSDNFATGLPEAECPSLAGGTHVRTPV